MRCESVMTEDVVYVRPTDTAQYAALAMRQENVGFLPVCDERGCVVGTLTDRDLAMRVCAEGIAPAKVTVGEVMTPDVVGCLPEDDLTHAERLMAERGKSRIVIVDEAAHLCGVISLTDVALRDSNRHAAHTLRKIVERETRY
jgi:CBS domain-containing protein